MRAFRDKAKKGMEALPSDIQRKIQRRFANTSSIVDKTAERMSRNIPFPKALSEAIREKDPKLANTISNLLEKTPEAKEEAEERVAETTVSAAVGTSALGTTGMISGRRDIPFGERFTLGLGGGIITSPEGMNYTWKAGLTAELGPVYLGMKGFRDPSVGTAGAGVATLGYSLEHKLGDVSFEVGGELGIDIWGERYSMVYPSVSFEEKEGRFSLSVAPLVGIPSGTLGVDASMDVKLGRATLGGSYYDDGYIRRALVNMKVSF